MSKQSIKAKVNEARKFINEVWLKDQRKFCASCGKTIVKHMQQPCCSNMYIVDNIKRIQDIASVNKEEKFYLINSFGSSKSKTLRFSIRMPEELMRALQRYFFNKYGEEFLVEIAEGRAFMKKFPQFTVAERI